MRLVRFLAVVLTLVLALSGLTFASAAPAEMAVVVDGRLVRFDAQPVVENGRMMVPFRAVLESLGATVGWDAKTQAILAQRGDRMVALVVGKSQAEVDGMPVTLEVAPFVREDRTYVPLRFLAEALDADVHWDAVSRTAVITTPMGAHLKGSDPAAVAMLVRSLATPTSGDLQGTMTVKMTMVAGDVPAMAMNMQVLQQGQVRGSDSLIEQQVGLVEAGQFIPLQNMRVAVKGSSVWFQEGSGPWQQIMDGPLLEQLQMQFNWQDQILSSGLLTEVKVGASKTEGGRQLQEVHYALTPASINSSVLGALMEDFPGNLTMEYGRFTTMIDPVTGATYGAKGEARMNASWQDGDIAYVLEMVLEYDYSLTPSNMPIVFPDFK